MKQIQKITPMNAIFGFKVQWTTPALKREWIDCVSEAFVDKKSATIEFNKQKSSSKTPKIEFRIKKINICK
jgi:hypothetical protein